MGETSCSDECWNIRDPSVIPVRSVAANFLRTSVECTVRDGWGDSKCSDRGMNPLLGRLGSMLEREDANIQGVHRQILFLRDELSSMSTALEMVSESEEANSQVKEWMGQLRELSYDVEDCIDIFLHHLRRVATVDCPRLPSPA